MGFKEQYANLKPGAARENLVYQYAIMQGKPKTVPITVPGPNDTKITYKVMPDFLMIEGIRVTLTPPTAQRIANHFGMQLPTAKMADQIYQNSTKIPARPLSGSGVTIDGKRYSGDQVVSNLISDSKANIEYNRIVEEQLKSKEIDPNKPVDGWAKTIVQSDRPDRTAFYGMWANPNNPNDKPIQGGSGVSSHDLNQTEYCSQARFVSNDVVVTKPDGSQINTTLDKVLKTKELAKSLTFTPAKGVQTYNSVKKAGPPTGYTSAKLDSTIKGEAESIAKGLLSKPMWTETTITLSNGKSYLAKVEPHSNAPKGISLYEKTTNQPMDKPVAQNIPAVQDKTKQKPNTVFNKLNEFLNSLDIF